MGKSATADATLQTALACLEAELGFDPMFGRTEYRQGLAKSFLFKFFLELQPTLPGDALCAVYLVMHAQLHCSPPKATLAP